MIERALDRLNNRFIYNFQKEVGFSRAILFGAGGRDFPPCSFYVGWAWTFSASWTTTKPSGRVSSQ